MASAQSQVPNIKPLRGMEDIVKIVERYSSDVASICAHTVDGTMDEYYIEIVNDVIFNITVFPVDRDLNRQDVMDDQQSVLRGMHQISNIIATIFGKDQRDVEIDITKRLETFPVDDVRTSRLLKHRNMLH